MELYCQIPHDIFIELKRAALTRGNLTTLSDKLAKSLASLPFFDSRPLAVAVSGGSDSLCLSILASKLHRGSVTAITVQTYWRENEWEDMKKLSHWLKRWGIKHVILSHISGKPATRSEEAARNQRYQILTQWCETNGVEYVLTGHNMEDQAVTFLMRALRGSGTEGLSCMRKIRRTGNVTVARPLLDCTRKEMQDFLRFHNQEWIDDPSNREMLFERNFLNQFLKDFSQRVGLDCAKNVASAARRIQRGEKVIDRAAAQLEAETVSYGGDSAVIECDLDATQDEVALRLISRVLKKVVGGAPFSLALLEKGLNKVRCEENFTMAGAVFLHGKDNWVVKKERRRTRYSRP